MKTELTTRYDSCKSFYGKAQIEDEGDEVKLYSYGTLAATYNKKTREPTVYNLCSQTTTRHVKEFFKQMGLPVTGKKDLLGWYND